MGEVAIQNMHEKLKLLVFIVAYNAESTIKEVLNRIPAELMRLYDTEVLVIDDSSADRTFESALEETLGGEYPFALNVLYNPVNQGYGGNQKIGYHYAVERGFDLVALVHGDAQYAPEYLPQLAAPLAAGEADAVLGSRMMSRWGALKGGMPPYKYIGNKILTWFQNRVLGTSLSEYHTGYRAYRVDALKEIPFDLNTQDFHFDTEIIIQLLFAGLRIKEIPIPTHYGDEVCYVQGWKYASQVIGTVLKAKVQFFDLFYDPKYDCRKEDRERYPSKLHIDSSQRKALETIEPGSKVLEINAAERYLGDALRKKGCSVKTVEVYPIGPGMDRDAFVSDDLNLQEKPQRLEEYDYVLLLDVVELMISPEKLVSLLRRECLHAPETTFLVSTGNIGFFITRTALFLGQFNYGKRGLLDMAHTRLFTFAAVRRLFVQGGFQVTDSTGIAAPFSLVIRQKRIGSFLTALNRALIKISKNLFAYQIYMTVKPLPSLESLLHDAERYSEERSRRFTSGDRKV